MLSIQMIHQLLTLSLCNAPITYRSPVGAPTNKTASNCIQAFKHLAVSYPALKHLKTPVVFAEAVWKKFCNEVQREEETLDAAKAW